MLPAKTSFPSMFTAVPAKAPGFDTRKSAKSSGPICNITHLVGFVIVTSWHFFSNHLHAEGGR